jgi:hypothetical protein
MNIVFAPPAWRRPKKCRKKQKPAKKYKNGIKTTTYAQYFGARRVVRIAWL